MYAIGHVTIYKQLPKLCAKICSNISQQTIHVPKGHLFSKGNAEGSLFKEPIMSKDVDVSVTKNNFF